jgi:hypothetical protein
MTPEVLAAHDGVLAVFVGMGAYGVHRGDWIAAWSRVEDLATATNSDDLVVHVADAQAIRLLCVDALCCVVVYQPTCKAAKSLPRAMRRCIEHVREERRKAERESSRLQAMYSRDGVGGDA